MSSGRDKKDNNQNKTTGDSTYVILQGIHADRSTKIETLTASNASDIIAEASSLTPSNWLRAEQQRNSGQDQVEQILEKIWAERILNFGEHTNGIKRFIKSIVQTEEWAIKIDDYFNNPDNRNNRSKFIEIFSQLSPAQLMIIDEGERFGVTERVEKTGVNLSDRDVEAIKQYISDKMMTASASISSGGQSLTLSSGEDMRNSPLCIYSITKIFTGVLALVMVKENIISEDDLMKPIKLSDESKKILQQLSPELAAHAETITLHQAMTHNAGFGDFTPNYVKAIHAAITAEYDLDLMSKAERKPGKIYLEETTEGLRYEVIGWDKEIKNNIIPWDKLPKDFPRNLSAIMESRDEFLPILLAHTSKAGHTPINDPTNNNLPVINNIHDLLRFDDKKIHKEPRYSNTGSLLVGLAIEHAYQEKFGKFHSFDEIMREYIINKVDKDKAITCFSQTMPANGQHSINMPEAQYMVASPAGCYWTTIDDLRKLGEHLCDLFQDPTLNRLLQKYGQEFTKNNGSVIFHDGAAPEASAILYASPGSRSVIATAGINSKSSAKELAKAIEIEIFTEKKLPSQTFTAKEHKM